ncbi:hypothetical protein EH243_00875 [Amphritea opalescens]|uniref:Uncharacterized protein n=1 Tax=Amphritea opalescens TaxID=2490544 RepID=A0A430KVM1_9GAMM|nr:hypothetical protein [Amphritea opalescens]RTE67532.1 hypothetical protein EH243_00875 [Amphritea opalescens]
MSQGYRASVYAIFLLFMLYGCTPLIGPHSPAAYENATALKAEVLITLSKANTPYVDNETAIDAIKLKAEMAYEFVKGVPGSQLSARQWEILKDPEGDLLGKFFKRWQERGTLSNILIQEYKALAADAFDEIICLEANKKEATACIAAGDSNNG